MHPTTVAVDLAKSVFEVAVADRRGCLQAHHRFTRRQFERFCRTQAASHVVMDACGMAHHWGRVARRCGYQVSLLPAQYVRPYVRRQKTGRTDVEALVEAARSGTVVPGAAKRPEQQALVALHRACGSSE